LTGTASPPPGLSIPRVSTGFRRPCGFIRSSDFCRVIAFVFLSYGYRSRGTRQISLGKNNVLRDDTVANTHAGSNRYWTSPPLAGLSTGHALRHFTCVRYRHASMTSFRPSLAGLATFASLRESRGAPRQSPCRFDVGFPLSGPRVWIFTSCPLFMPITPRPALALPACRASARGCAALTRPARAALDLLFEGGTRAQHISIERYVTSQRGKCQGQIPPLPYQPSIGRSAYRLGRSLQDALRSASQVALRPHRCDVFVQGTCLLS